MVLLLPNYIYHFLRYSHTANNPFQEYNYLVKEDPVQHAAFIDIINKLKQGENQRAYIGERGLKMACSFMGLRILPANYPLQEYQFRELQKVKRGFKMVVVYSLCRLRVPLAFWLFMFPNNFVF